MTEAQRLAKFMAVEGELHRSQGRETLAGYFGQAAAHLRRLEAECEQLRADAGRYRWLRSRPERVSVAVVVQGHWLPAIGEQLDAAIDTAMKETK